MGVTWYSLTSIHGHNSLTDKHQTLELIYVLVCLWRWMLIIVSKPQQIVAQTGKSKSSISSEDVPNRNTKGHCNFSHPGKLV